MKDLFITKKAEWFVGISLSAMLTITFFTFKIDQETNNWVCGSVLMLNEVVVLIIQFLIFISVIKSERIRSRLFYLIGSFFLLILTIVGFANFISYCS